jgi:hypothetical protein
LSEPVEITVTELDLKEMEPEKPTPQPNPRGARPESARALPRPDIRRSEPAKFKERTANRTGFSSEGRSGQPYVPMPIDEKDQPKEEGAAKKKRNRWLVLAIAALAIGGGSFMAMQRHSDPAPIVFNASDIDEQATAAAQAALNSGKIPAELAHTGPEILSKIKSGEMALSKPHRILPSENSPGMVIHVLESLEGKLIGVDILTDERPIGTPIPISRAGTTRVHFVVEQAGSRGTVVCSVLGRGSTAPLATGQEADVLVSESTN